MADNLPLPLFTWAFLGKICLSLGRRGVLVRGKEGDLSSVRSHADKMGFRGCLWNQRGSKYLAQRPLEVSLACLM